MDTTTPAVAADVAASAVAAAVPTVDASSHLHADAPVIPHSVLPAAPGGEPPKKTGRPAHPLWAHFHRGEKRNRYHYHAFCVYCVERYGAEHVPATRGVSIDMLRHLEKCTNCPRRVVDVLKEVCGQRDAVRFDRYGKKKLQQQQQPAQAQVQQPQPQPAVGTNTTTAATATTTTTRGLETTPSPRALKPHHHEQQHHQLAGEATAHTFAVAPSTVGTRASGGATTPHALRGSPATACHALSPNATTSTSTAPPPSKRIRVDATTMTTTDANTAAALDDKLAVLRLAVAANLSVEALQNDEFQQLLGLLRPSLASAAGAAETVAGLLEPAFVQESAARLAADQLDRVKEGMLNSTIKGGLTLSLHSWTTLDRQYLVAFNLVNSNGDSACVCVEDMSNGQAPACPVTDTTAAALPYTSEQLAAKIEEVLGKLQQQNISVMGIVADTTLALNAARRVCLTMNKRQSLLVVPCFSRVLSVLAGAVLTHPHFVHVVGEMIEIAAYLLNAKVLDGVRALSGDARASFLLPNRENWFSFVECHSRLLRYREAIVQYCQSTEVVAPHVFKTLVLRENQAIWTRMEELRAFLAPLHETYSVFFQQLRTVHDDAKPDAGEVDVLEDDLAAAHGLTLAHVMYQFARMTQQYQTLLLSAPDHFIASSVVASQDVAQLVLIHVDTMWRRYELPAMLLAFVFNFHLDTTLVDMAKPCSAWPSIAEYFQLYYHRWFSGATNNGGTTTTEITRDRVAEILDTIKLNHFPFDADTTSDYVDVSSFYSFVSDSHPEICALCCRLYAISLLTANASRIVRGIGYVPIAAQTTRDPPSVELLLHVGFASSTRRNVFPTGDAASALGGMEAMVDGAADAVLWSEDIWQGFADDWRLFVDQELLMDEFDAISNASAAEDAAAALLAVKVPVQELFVDTLPAMTVTLEAPTTPGGQTTAMSGPSLAAAPHGDASSTPHGAISVGI